MSVFRLWQRTTESNRRSEFHSLAIFLNVLFYFKNMHRNTSIGQYSPEKNKHGTLKNAGELVGKCCRVFYHTMNHQRLC